VGKYQLHLKVVIVSVYLKFVNGEWLYRGDVDFSDA
jgi:hypothetical protein